MSDGVKSPALSRIEGILDEDSFVELQSLVTKRSTDFGDSSEELPSDGVVTGHGLVNGELVFVYSQDPSVKNGSIGEMHAKKILNVYEMAMKVGAPVIGILDSSGVRLAESMDSLEAIGSIIRKACRCKGSIPLVTAVFGNCGGGLSALCGVSDFCFMTEGAKLFVNTPDSIPGNSAEKLDTSGCAFQTENTGVVDACGSESEVSEKIRRLLSIIPSSDREGGRFDEDESDDLNRSSDQILARRCDIRSFAAEIADGREFVETKASFAKDTVTGFIRLGGQTIGIVGQGCAEKEKALLSADGCTKAADFVNFCDSFYIPVLSLVNAEGYSRSVADEKSLPSALASLFYAFSETDVPKVSVYLSKAVGSSYLFMDSKSAGADLVFAYDDTETGPMDAHDAARIIAGEDGDVNGTEKEFAAKNMGAKNAARRGYVDRILTPADTRKYLIAAFDMLATKEAYD